MTAVLRIARKVLTLLIIVHVAATTALGQTERTLDLATMKSVDTIQLKPGRYKFKLKSLAPKYKYVVAISEGVEVIPPLPTAALNMGTPCTALLAATPLLDKEAKESEIPARVAQLNAALQAEGGLSGCVENAATARRLLAKTERTIDDIYTLNAGDYVIVEVSRIEDDKPTATWVRRYTTGPAGEWKMTYGYAFPAYMRISHWSAVREGEQHFARQIGDTGSTYVIEKGRRSSQFDAVPTVMFSYAAAAEKALAPSLSAGLAVDITDPVLFVGPGITYRSNLRITFGTAFRKEKVLMGRYATGDTVKTNLTAEQLHEDAFRIRPFVSVTLRFDKNPFKKDPPAEAEGQKPADKKPEEKKPAPPTDAAKSDNKPPSLKPIQR